MFNVRNFLLAAVTLVSTGFAQAGGVQIAVASNFLEPMRILADEFEKKTGHTVSVSSGGTGKLYAQVVNGAPFEIFLSADDETPIRLEKEGRALPGSRFTYSVGRLALWSAKAGVVDGTPGVLGKPNAFKHLALANPKLAPYGAAAKAVMAKLGVQDSLAAKIVQGENIGQAYQFVRSGNAEIGFVALSQVQANGKLKSGSMWLVPADLHQELRQDAILLNAGKSNPVAHEFLGFLKSAQARARIKAFGYDLP